MNAPKSVDDYIERFGLSTQAILRTIRTSIGSVVPDATESISYGMPAYKLNGKPVIYFAAFESHIGIYATPEGHAEFEEELSEYKRGKGSVQIPIDQPMPIELIQRMTRYRAELIRKGVK